MLFFLLHLRQVSAPASWSKQEIESAREYPWIACFQDRLSGFATYLCLIILPIGASFLLLFKHGESGDNTTRCGAILSLFLIAAGVFTTIAIHGFRKHLQDGESSANPALSEPVKGI
jgi:hypothetical protein